MKTIFTISLIIFTYLNSFSQNIYIHEFSTSADEFFLGLVENSDSSIYLLSCQNNSTSAPIKTRTIIHKIDYYGNLIDSFRLFDYQDNTLISMILKKDSNIYAFGIKTLQVGSENVIVKYDLNFNKLFEKHLFYDSLISLKEVQDVVQYDSIFNIINYDRYINQGFPGFSIIKVNENLDSLGSFLSYPYTGIAYKGLANNTNSNFRVFTYLYYAVGWGQSVYFDKDLNIIRIDSLPDLIHQFNDAIWKNDTSFIVTGITENTRDSVYKPNNYDWDLGLALIDTSNKQIDYKYQYRLGTSDCPAWNKNIVKTKDNKYFYTGTLNRIFSPFDTSIVVLTKLDSNLNIIWEKYITDGFKSIDVAGIYLLSDSSIILLIWKYENHYDWSRDAYAYKISKDGEILFVTNLESLPNIEINIFPNPSPTTMNINLQSPNQSIAELKVYNSIGQEVYFIKPNKENIQIDVRSFKSGIYFVKGLCKNGDRFSGKFVKE